MAIYNLKQLDDRINALQAKYIGIKHIDEILTSSEKAAIEDWFEKWFVFYDAYRDKENELNPETMQHLNNKYHETNIIVDKYQKASDVIEQQEQQKTSQVGQEILSQQEQIDREERQRYEREQQVKKQGQIEKKQQVKAVEYGTKTYDQLAKSWDAVINLWDRIKTLPSQDVVTTVNNTINRWLDFYEGSIVEWYTLEQPVPGYLTDQLPKWHDLYNKTKKVVETSAAQSAVLDEPEKAEALGIEHVKLAPGMSYDPETGVITAPETLITGRVGGVAPPSFPQEVLPKGEYSLPSPIIQAQPPVYKPPATIIIKQCYPPVEPITEPEIDPGQPMIYEPAPRTLGDIPGGGLVEPVVDDGDNPFEEIGEKIGSTWPWFLGIGILLFLSRTK